MATSIGALQVDLLLQAVEFVRSINRASEQVNQLGRAVTQQNTLITRGFTAATSAVKSFAVGMAAAVGATSIAGVARLGKQALDTAGNLGELAQQAGVATGELQALQLAGVQVGVSQEQLVTSLAQFGRRVGEAARGTGELAKTMAHYGISARDSLGQIRPSVDVLGDFADAVQQAGSAQEQLTILSTAFGSRIGSKLLPLLSEGAEGFRQWMKTAEAAGLVMDAAFIKRADAASDAMATLQFAVAKGFEIGVVEAFSNEVGSSVDALTRAREAGEAFGRIVGAAINQLIPFIEEFNRRVQKTVETINKIIELWDKFVDLVKRSPLILTLPDTGAAALEVDIKTSTGWLKGWNEQLAEGRDQAAGLTGTIDGLTSATKELTAEQNRLAEAGKFLKDTTAEEERATAALEKRLLVQERLAQTSAHKEKGMLPTLASEDVQESADETTRIMANAYDDIRDDDGELAAWMRGIFE